jgi:predicted nicotinamide N-methyase
VSAVADLVTDEVELSGRTLSILRPRDAEALLDEEAFEHEEFLPYWAELWPSGPALAHALAGRDLHGARVLELGCGLALPAFAAALRGARVLATDWSPDAIDLVRANAEWNRIDLEAAVCDWACPEPLLARAPWNLVLAADVLYERRNADALLELLPRLTGASGEVLVAEPGRPPAGAFFTAAAERWDVTVVAERHSPRVVVRSLSAPRRRLRRTGGR